MNKIDLTGHLLWVHERYGMNSYQDKSHLQNTRAAADSQATQANMPALQFRNNGPETISQEKQEGNEATSPGVKQFKARPSGVQPIQKKANATGMPDQLKAGVENLSGHSMDDVKVHYNSVRPAQLQAHAFAQGTDIHIGPGQEKHLPHEAWHVVQQKQGRVKPTLQMKGKVGINDDKGLEREADVMGAKALSTGSGVAQGMFTHPPTTVGAEVVQRNIEYNTKKKKYETNSDRPGWLKAAEDALLDEYNLRYDVTVKKVDYAKKKMARCHIVAFETIQTHLADYLNDTSRVNDMGGYIDQVLAHLSDNGNEKKGAITAWRYLQDEVKTGSTDSIVKVANALLSRLNSVSENLRAGDKYLNSYIQDNLDPFFAKTPNGKYQLGSHSKTMMQMGSSYSGELLRTPQHEKRVVTSEGPVAISDMTPHSQQLVENHPYTTRKIHSSSVKSRVYGSHFSEPQVRGFKQKTVVDPRIADTVTKIDFAKLQIKKMSEDQEKVRQVLLGLIAGKKAVGQYNELLLFSANLPGQLQDLQTSLQQNETLLQQIPVTFQANKEKLSNLNLQLSLANLSKTFWAGDESKALEQNEQTKNMQELFLMFRSPHYNQKAHQGSVQALNQLSKNPRAIAYAKARAEANKLQDQVNDLEAQQQQLHQYFNSVKEKIAGLKEKITLMEKLNNSIPSALQLLERDNDVAGFKQLLAKYNTMGEDIDTAKGILQQLETLLRSL